MGAAWLGVLHLVCSAELVWTIGCDVGEHGPSTRLKIRAGCRFRWFASLCLGQHVRPVIPGRQESTARPQASHPHAGSMRCLPRVRGQSSSIAKMQTQPPPIEVSLVGREKHQYFRRQRHHQLTIARHCSHLSQIERNGKTHHAVGTPTRALPWAQRRKVYKERHPSN